MNRIFHTWDKWECYSSGFYEIKPPNNMTQQEAEKKYKDLLSNIKLFSKILEKIITEWKNSCEHYLTNEKMNRIAWMGQAALAYKYKIPARFCGGYNLLTEEQKQQADLTALKYINKWMKKNKYSKLSEKEIKSKTKANLY